MTPSFCTPYHTGISHSCESNCWSMTKVGGFVMDIKGVDVLIYDGL